MSRLTSAAAPLTRILCAFALLMLTAPFVRAQGPVPAAGVPGGVVATDDDASSAEKTKWGRAGGRTFTFQASTPGAFTSLSWGAVVGTVPGIAYDGAIDSASENLTFNAAQSNLPGGIARWTGSVTVLLLSPNGTFTLPSRFTLTVMASGSPAALTFNDASPGASLLPVGQLTANLLFEVDASSVGYGSGFQPALDVFDALHTNTSLPPGSGGPAITQFTSGFYFALASTLSLEQLQTDLDGRLDTIKNTDSAIKDDTAFLRIDTPGRLGQLSTDVFNLTQLVRTLPQPDLTNLATHGDVQNLENSFTNLATHNDVNNSSQQLTQTLLVLWGLAPCPPEAGDLCTTAKFIKDLATKASIDDVTTQLTAIKAKIDALPTGSSIGDVETAIAGVGGQVSGVSTQIAALGGTITALQNAIGAAGQTELDVQVVEEPRLDSTQRRFLLKITREGELVPAHFLRLLVVVQPKKSGPSTVQDATFLATVTPLMNGLIEVTFNDSGMTGVVAFHFDVRYQPDSTTIVDGSALVTGAK